MLYFIKDKKNCTGCTACYSACPKNCIEMIRDVRGFLYPEANGDICTNCGMCEKVCPILKNGRVENSLIEQEAVAAIIKDMEKWKLSTSGGAFECICEAMSKRRNKVVVYGAVFDGLYVKHVGAVYPDIQKMYKSKYVQSDMEGCFREIREKLKNGENVIFSGTPCQNAGLKSFLLKEYDNLFCIDFICHGVGSPKVFDNYIKERELKKKKKISEYIFRYKLKRFGDYKRYISKIIYEDRSYEYEEMDEYNNLFLNQLCLRDCCGETCKFRNQKRWSDITIADFNNFRGIFPDIYDSRGYSSVIVNTEKGKQIFEMLVDNMNLYRCRIEDIKKENPLFCRTTAENPKRDEFFEDYINGMTISCLNKKYVSGEKRPLKYYIADNTPYLAKYVLRKIKKLLKNH